MQNGVETVSAIDLYAVQVDKGAPIEVPEPIFSSFYVEDWGDIGNRLLGGGWSINNDSTTLVGDVSISGAEAPGNWTAVRGGFGGTFSADENEALIVRGEIEINGDLDMWNPLRFGMYNHTDIGELNHQYTDSAQWGYIEYAGTDSAYFKSNEAGAYGFLVTNNTGANEAVSGQGGLGSAWAVNGGSWLSTWSGGQMALGDRIVSPRRANMAAGLYFFEMSVHPLPDGSNEFRWYIISEDEQSYLQGGVHNDTTGLKTDFNGFVFSMQNGVETVTEINLYAVQVDKGEPIEVPAPIFSGFYVDTWGFLGGDFGGESVTDSAWSMTPGALVGDVTIGGPALKGFATVAGDLGLGVTPGDGEALQITGDILFTGGGFEDDASFNFGIFEVADLGNLDSTETVGYTFDGLASGATGFYFSPNNSAGSIFVNDGVLSSATSTGTPTAGYYSLTIAVNPTDGGAEVRAKIEKEDGSFVYEAGAVTDAFVAAPAFNTFVFGVGNSTTTEVSVEALFVDLVDASTVDVSTETIGSELPTKFALDQNYPNPFNPSTRINFALPENSNVQLSVYNMLGQKVMTLVDGRMEAGYHQVNFNAASLASGMYIYRIEAGTFSSTKKMMLIK